MLTIGVEKFDDFVVVECRGRLTQSDSVFKLRDVVLAEVDSPIIVLDLSEVQSISGGGLGMLAFLDHWAREHDIHLKLYSPSRAVMDGMVQNRSIGNFEMASMNEMMSLLSQAENSYPMAA